MLSTNELFPWWDQKPFCHLILIHLVKNFWQSKDILIYHVHSFLWKVKLFLSSFSWGWGNFYSLTLHEWWSSSEFSSCKSLFTYLWLISLPFYPLMWEELAFVLLPTSFLGWPQPRLQLLPHGRSIDHSYPFYEIGDPFWFELPFLENSRVDIGLNSTSFHWLEDQSFLPLLQN